MSLIPINRISFPNSFVQATDVLGSTLMRRIIIVAGVALAALGIAFLICYHSIWNKKAGEDKKLIKQIEKIPVEQTLVTVPVEEKVQEVAQTTIPVLQPTQVSTATVEGKVKKREEMIAKAIERWSEKTEDTLERTALQTELTTLATAGHEEDYLSFVGLLVEKVKENDLLLVYEQAGKLFLSVDQFGELTKVIFAKFEKPWALLLRFLKALIHSKSINKDIINRLLDEKLSSLDNEDVLEQLYALTCGKSDIEKKLSLSQVDIIFRRWKAYWHSGDVHLPIFQDRKDRKELVDLFAKNEIGLEEFIRKLSRSENAQIRAISAEVSGWAILRILNTTDSENVKKNKIKNLLPDCTHGEHATHMALHFLVKHCPPAHLRLVLLSIQERGGTGAETEALLTTYHAVINAELKGLPSNPMPKNSAETAPPMVPAQTENLPATNQQEVKAKSEFELRLESAIEEWKINNISFFEMEGLRFRLENLSHKNLVEYFKCVSLVLEKLKTEDHQEVKKQLPRLFIGFSESQFKNLTKAMLGQSNWEHVITLIKVCHKSESRMAILQEILPTLDDGEKLAQLFELFPSKIQKWSLPQLDKMIKYWQSSLDESALYVKLCQLKARKDISEVKNLLQQNGIDLQLIAWV